MRNPTFFGFTARLIGGFALGAAGVVAMHAASVTAAPMPSATHLIR